MKRAGWIFGLAFLIGGLFALTLMFTTGQAKAAVMRCHTYIHYQPVTGNAGHITEWETCGGGTYTFRARVECFPEPHGSGGRGVYHVSNYTRINNHHVTAGCKRGTYPDNGGYQQKGSSRYVIIWRLGGHPV